MLAYITKKLKKRKIKREFKEYGSHVATFELENEGPIEFALWDNPLESPKSITQGDVDFYRQFIPAGGLAIDIGAHIGDTTVPMALAAGKTGTALAFDPNPMVFKILEANAKLNPDKTHIVPVNYGIAVEPGEYYFNSSEATHNNGGISKEQKNKHGKYQLKDKVTAVNLLDFLTEKQPDFLTGMSLLKIDTEGMDLHILESVKDVISQSRPTVIAECFRRLEQSKREKLFSLFDDMAFDLFYLESFDVGGKTQKINKKEDMANWPHFDFCAIPKEKTDQVFK